MDYLQERVVPWIIRNRSFSGWMALIVAGILFVVLPIGVFFILFFIALIGIAALIVMGWDSQDREEYRRMDRYLADPNLVEPVRLPGRPQPERPAVAPSDPVPDEVQASWRAAHDARLDALAVQPKGVPPHDRPEKVDLVPAPAPASVPGQANVTDDLPVTEVAPPLVVMDVRSQTIIDDPGRLTSDRGESAFRQTTYRTVLRTPAGSDSRSLEDLISQSAVAFRDDCADALRRLGYARFRHEETALPFAPDLIGEDSLGRRTVVRCRQDDPSASVDAATIQAFVDEKDARHRLDRGVLITTGRFDSSAIRLARQHDLALVDGGDLSVVLGLVG